MNDIIIKNPVQKARFEILYNENKDCISNDLELLIKNVILIFKRHSNNEELIILALIYWLLYFSIIEKNHEIITKKDLENLKILKNSFKLETKWEFKSFLDEVLVMDKDLFLLKTIIKYNILSFEKKFINIVPNLNNYYKSIWYLIPYLTYIESPFLSFFQDIYFKKIYPHKFEKTRKYYIEKISKVEFPWEHMFTIVNNIWELMTESEVIWKTKVRRKTYFSIYNKLVRKKWAWVLDTIWIRLVFWTIDDLKIFAWNFENRYVYIDKKDYINNPKENGYRSLHYKYISPYRDTQILVEIQLRTTEMDKEISDKSSISHFSYTVKQNKWHKIFKEIHAGYNYINKKLHRETSKNQNK